jgi:hypothetical protein
MITPSVRSFTDATKSRAFRACCHELERATSTLPKYLTVTDNAQGAVFSIASASSGAGVVIAAIGGATTDNLPTLLAHAMT